MKVILIASNPRLGQIGEVVEVKSGYAKNFLIPQKQAICFTENNNKVFAAKKHEFEIENAKNVEIASKVKVQIDGKDIIILQNASDDGRLYGSVSSTLIASKLNELTDAKPISRSQIFLRKAIKEIGVYDAVINLYSEVNANVRLIVTRSESEVDALLKSVSKEEKSQESATEEKSEAQEKKAKKPRKTKSEE
jgi:large subunit ribosomal protein L9